MTRTVFCTKLNKEAEGLAHPPYPGDAGKRLYDNISKEAWQQWLAHQTLLINEHHLSLINPDAQKFLTEEMEKFLFSDDAEKPAGYVAPSE